MHPFNNMISLAQESTSATAPVLAGNSFEAHALRQLVAIAAKTQAPVQLTGPTGSGHLDIAKAIHDLSSLASEPFVAADNEQMSEDHFEIRWEGTLFLGDVGHLSHSVKNALMEWMASPYGANVRVVTNHTSTAMGIGHTSPAAYF
jgi:transcriptional regulator with AAA-type ATPase domain